MLAGRPGASGAAGLGAAASDPIGPRDGGGRPRPATYLDMKTHLEKNLEEERQILLQQQKICRNRARKYFMESNQRKKAFEEKRKEQEEREYQIREQILQQRKQKFEEVTEKFQRAHIPLSQRRRAVFQKPVPPLEEALKQIQESNLKSEVNIPLSHRSTVNWKAIDSALPSALSENDYKHQKCLVHKIQCDKEMKENTATLSTDKNIFRLKLEETQKLLEDQHLSSLQKFCDEVNQITNSETLSSIDSLEAGEHEEIYLALNMEPSLSSQQNSVSLKSANLSSAHLTCFDEDNLSFSKTQHINNWLTDLNAQNTQSIKSYSDILSRSSVLPSWEYLDNKEQNPSSLSRTVERTTSANDSVVFVYSRPVVTLDKKDENISETSAVKTSDCTDGAFKGAQPPVTKKLSVTKSPAFPVSKASTIPEHLTWEAASFSIQEKPLELTRENKTTSIPASSVPVATPLILPSNSQSARPLAENMHIKEIDPIQCSDKLGELKDAKSKKINYFNCNKEELSLFSDDFRATCIPQNSNSKDRKQKPAEPPAPSSTIVDDCELIDWHKKMKYNTHERNGVRSLKSILKKESKYEPDYLKAIIINQGFKFRNQKAEAIRDSIELTKQKGRGAEIPKTIKKLRWFDETGNTESSVGDHHPVKSRAGAARQWSQPSQAKSSTSSSLISVLDCATNSAAGKKSKADAVSEKVADLGGCETDHVPLNSFIPSDCIFTKQAWSTCRKEESKTPAHTSDSKSLKGKPYRGAKAIRRTGSAKVQSGFECMNRKATVIQSESASKANNTLVQTQGKLIIPHPPPKPPSNIRGGKNMHMSQCQSIMPEKSQNVTAHNWLSSAYALPTEHTLNQWKQESSPAPSDACSDLVTVIPSLPSYSSECQTSAKLNHSNATHMASQQDRMLYCVQRSPVCEESSQSLTHRNTEEVLSWKRRSNRHLNEGATDSTVTRRKRIVENKWRNLLEQKRKNSGSVGAKHTEQMINFGQSVQLSSSEPKQTTRGSSKTEEVSDSTSEFLMAENFVNTSVPEDEILTVMNSKQMQKPNLSINKTQQSNICALSSEEQKILQSLNRLNERLYYIQEAICKNPSIKNTFQIIPLLVR
ncbi:centrosomal protein of 126 kDa isoform X3 [Nannospalax galili]|uniref:centrosomal protein of 126 kDa isoform X3 n=1 Tax=Nannospalax galili TaxID=1026970 RepID=UPI00111C624C|nr:centrosomal protein of 126 kDa isoform X3 [Nannospalax galili]